MKKTFYVPLLLKKSKMLRVEKEYFLDVTLNLKKRATYWVNATGEDMIWLDSNNYPDSYRRFEAVLAFSPELVLKKMDTGGAFNALKRFISRTKDYIFGYLSYDLKNDTEDLQSENFDGLGFPELYFFQPKKIIFFKEKSVVFSYLQEVSSEIESDFKSLCAFDYEMIDNHKETSSSKNIKSRISKESYVQKVNKMKGHIARGDIYEANFCQEFYVENAEISPLFTYWKLNDISQSPFASFMKVEEFYVLSASPERYLQRNGKVAISQPIKGTAKRSSDKATDSKLRSDLEQNPKERSENIMIVDLVRNDLSLYAEKASVQVVELCKPYTFRQVHQLISTVRAEIKEGIHSVDVLCSTFPMGSMTGAPKISAMQIIESLEQTKRSVYSGAIGYFTPNTDFDFNVVIRSILYNSKQNYLSFSVGSAITIGSDAEKEYEECLIKAAAMKKVLED